MKRLALIAPIVALSACAGPPPIYASASSAPVASAPRPPVAQSQAGLGDILGQSAQALTARLGETRIDLTEGDARKLQFAGRTCVLDIYLYPPAAGQAPVATHVEARQQVGGASVDQRACLREIAAR